MSGRRHFSAWRCGSTAVVLAICALAQVAAAQSRPNIVFVVTDDLRWDTLGIAGHPIIKTPSIDRIGREGMAAENFFVTTPLCSPSRANFLTGRYAHAHRIINNDKNGLAGISHTLMSWPRLLRESGYESAFIGKWHMGFDDTRRPGFDHWISFKAQGLFIDGVVNENGIRRQLSGYMTDYLNREAAKFIRKKREKPFLLYVSQKAVHRPFLPAKRHENLYSDAKLKFPEPAPGDLEGKPAVTRERKGVDLLRLEGHTPEPQESRRGRGEDPESIVLDQLRCMASIDEGVGMIFDALEDVGKLDETVVIFTSDNGFLMGEHGQFNSKRWAYEESIRIPFVMRYPPLIEPNSKPKQLLLNIDVAPTMLELAGVSTPDPIHGESFVPVLKNNNAPGRESFLAEYFVEANSPYFAHWQAVRTKDWKYIHYPALPGMDEVYDLANDPRELRNLISDAAQASRRAMLEQTRLQLLDETR